MGVGDARRLTEDGAKDIWARVIVAGTEAKADFCCSQILHRAEALDEFCQQGRAGGRNQLCGFVTLRNWNPSRSENLQCGGSGNRKASMGALNETGAFDNAAGEHFWLTQHLQRDTGA